MATIGEICLILGHQNALLAVETRLWRCIKSGSKRHKFRASADAKRAGKEGVVCMLMAPEPSSWAAGATVSRLPVGADQRAGPKVDLRGIIASEEATRQHEITCSSATVYCHVVSHKNLNLREG